MILFRVPALFDPFLRRLLQVPLPEPNTHHQGLHSLDIITGAMCRLRSLNASRSTKFIGTADRVFLTG